MPSRLLLSVLIILVAAGAQALDRETRLVSPIHSWSATDFTHFDDEWLHVKFIEGSEVRIEGQLFADDGGLALGSVNAILASARVLDLRPTFQGDRAHLRQLKAAGEALSGAVGPDLSLWFDLRVAGGPGELARMVNALNADDAVEIAHPAAICEPAVILGDARLDAPLPADPNTPDFTGLQGYLYDPPVGLDAPAVWAHPGGKGEAMKFIDVELCWTEDHEDFDFGQLFYVGGAGQDAGYETHGTAVLGEIIGQNNGFGVNGFAPAIQYGVVAVTVAEWPNVPHYFQEAIDHLDTGDVWLIELQMYPPGADATPMEWLQVNYDVIWTGCWSLGIVCIEAGANGSQDLDSPFWGGVFDRTLRDSGAIMVGAGTPYGRVAEWFTNYGSRMDVHAWGSAIVTTGYGDLYNGGPLQTRYTDEFGGTSGASPMITGSALCLQGIAKYYQHGPLLPHELRELLNSTGVPHLDPTKEIGPRPDLEAAAAPLLDLSAAPGEGTAGGLAVTGLPNPFTQGASIHFTLPADGEAALSVFDVQGRCIRTMRDPGARAGANVMVWDGKDDGGRDLASGVYLFRLEAAGAAREGRLVKIR